MKKFFPKVSVIIPVYNGSNYLKEAIDSALAQTYKNIEIIVVNDGSSDDGATEAIAKSYGKKIKYYKKENGGVATALNLGIKKMTGDYFSWLSHDDLYCPNKIKKQIRFLSKLSNRDVVLFSNYLILEGNKMSSIIHNHNMLKTKKKYSLLRGCINGITVLIPKIILDETGIFNQELRCTQDYDYWCRAQERYEFVHMRDMLAITRIHPSQDTKVSSCVITECNKLWIDMINSMTEEEKAQYEGSIYNFYSEMIKFLGGTAYSGALKYCQEKISGLNPDKRTFIVLASDFVKSSIIARIIRRFSNQSIVEIIKSIYYKICRKIKR